MKSTRIAALSLMLALIAARALAQEPVVSTHADAAPAGIAEPIRALLAPGGHRVTVGAKTLDFWWVKSLPMTPVVPDVAWSAVEEGTLVGVVKLSASYPDIRGKTMKPGVYTLRYGIQPSDGNHLGVSPNREFLLIAPAAADTSPAPLARDGAINLAKQAIGLSHPAAWSIDPPIAPDRPLSIHKTDTGQKGVIFDVPVSRGGKDAGTLKFGLILIGEIQS